MRNPLRIARDQRDYARAVRHRALHIFDRTSPSIAGSKWIECSMHHGNVVTGNSSSDEITSPRSSRHRTSRSSPTSVGGKRNLSGSAFYKRATFLANRLPIREPAIPMHIAIAHHLFIVARRACDARDTGPAAALLR